MKLFLIGGFLGSGKTTAIAQACLLLKERVKVGVITNDQGAQLVDSAFISNLQVPSKEVVNGCFCCRYSDLEAGIEAFARDEAPDVVFAESVGSCADLVATVVNPLLHFHPSLQIVISVFADARILLRRKEGRPSLFEEEVEYIYGKQLDEADVLVVNKVDLLEPHEVQALQAYLAQTYPGKTLLFQNSLRPESIREWIACLEQFQLKGKRKSLDLNYVTYGAGEARLAWLDEEIEIITENGSAVEAATLLIRKIVSAIREANYPVGHLKFLLSDGQQKSKISFVSLQQINEHLLFESSASDNCKVLVNARVQAEPAILKQLLASAISELKEEKTCKVVERKMLAFKPGFPKPQHRMIS